jgi:hypothetical protein
MGMRGDQHENSQVRGAGTQHHLYVLFLLLAHICAIVVDHNAKRFAFCSLCLFLPKRRVRHLVQFHVVHAVVLDRTRRAMQHKDFGERGAPGQNLETEGLLAPVGRCGEQHAAIRCHGQVVLLLRPLQEALLVRGVQFHRPTGPFGVCLGRHAWL